MLTGVISALLAQESLHGMPHVSGFGYMVLQVIWLPCSMVKPVSPLLISVHVCRKQLQQFRIEIAFAPRVIGVDSLQVIDEGLLCCRTTQLSVHRGG